MATPRGAEALRVFQLRQRQVGRFLAERITLLVDGLDLSAPARAWPAVEAALVPMVQAAHGQSARAGAAFYTEFRGAALDALGLAVDAFDPVVAPTVPAPAVAGTARTVGLSRAVEANLNRAPITSDRLAGHLVASMDRLAQNGGRDTITASGNSDRRAQGWARVSGTGSPCAWCAMLISRGGEYATKATAAAKAGGHRYHDSCRCQPVPIFDMADPWPPGSKEISDRWTEVSGGGGPDAVKDWRKDWNAANPTAAGAAQADTGPGLGRHQRRADRAADTPDG